MKVKLIGLSILIGGGLIALLLFSMIRVRAIISFDGDNYTLHTEKYFSFFDQHENHDHVSRYFDFYNNGQELEIELERGEVTILQRSHEIFKSDPSFDVNEFLIGDFDNDGSDDLAVYLWKHGNYGEALPFWEDENDNSYKFHLFLYSFVNGEMKSKWNSSNLPYINTKTILADLNGDGKNEIIVLERPYKWGEEGFQGETVAVWEWNEWGFWLEWRSNKGKYNDFSLEYI